MKKKSIFINLAFAGVVLAIAVILLVVFRTFAGKYNYKTIPVSELKPGMILSMGSILLFAGSRVKGLPSFSTEDLKSRLSAGEVDSIGSPKQQAVRRQ